MQLLLMPEQQITTSEASCAIGAFKGLLLGVRALMTLQVLQSRKGATAGGTDMGPRLVCLGRGNIAIGAGLAISFGLLLSLLRWSCSMEKEREVQNSWKTLDELIDWGAAEKRLTRHVSWVFVDTGEIYQLRALVSFVASHSI